MTTTPADAAVETPPVEDEKKSDGQLVLEGMEDLGGEPDDGEPVAEQDIATEAPEAPAHPEFVSTLGELGFEGVESEEALKTLQKQSSASGKR